MSQEEKLTVAVGALQGTREKLRRLVSNIEHDEPLYTLTEDGPCLVSCGIEDSLGDTLSEIDYALAKAEGLL